MLVGYHRIYDTLILIFFIVLLFRGLADPRLWKLNRQEQTMLMVFLAAIPPILILPARLVDKVFPHYYGKVNDAVSSAFFVLMLILSMFLLRRYLQKRRIETIPQRADSGPIPIEAHLDTQPNWVDHA
jgi:hypothetical protein